LGGEFKIGYLLESLLVGGILVEAEGIEPSSRNREARTSSHLVYILLLSSFPPVDGMKRRLAGAISLTLSLLEGKLALFSDALLTP